MFGSFGKGIRIARIFGIDIVIDYSWFLVFILWIWLFSNLYEGHVFLKILVGAFAGAMFGVSILFHEFFHSLVAKKFFGLQVPKIELMMLGGMSYLEFGDRKDHESAWQEFAISIVGPLSSVLFGLLVGVFVFLSSPHYASVWDFPAFLDSFLPYLAFINFLLAGFNMLPAFPMDGGRVLRSVIWWRTRSQRKATRIASVMGKYFGLAFMVYGGISTFLLFTSGLILPGNIWFILLGFFLKQGAERSWFGYLFDATKVRDVVTPAFPSLGPGNLREPHCRLDDSLGKFIRLMEKSVAARLPVLDAEDNCVGFLAASDILNFLEKNKL